MSDEDEMHWTIREFRECVVDSSYLETFIAGLAEKKKLKVPFHSTIEGLDVVLRLKPPTWRLSDFSKYMNFLSFCSHKEFGPLEVVNPLGWIMHDGFHHFRLDENLDANDIEFFLRNLVGISFNRILPSDFTGESMINGKLSEFLTLENYNEVIKFINSSREYFEDYSSWVYIFLSRAHLGELVSSKFNLFFDEDFFSRAARLVYPSLPPASGPLSYQSNPSAYTLVSEDRTTILYNPNPRLKELKILKTKKAIKKRRKK